MMIIKVTKYYASEDDIGQGYNLTDWASEEEPVWMRGIPADHPGSSIQGEVWLYGGDPANDAEMSITNADEYEVVAPEDLPDHICAALARLALEE